MDRPRRLYMHTFVRQAGPGDTAPARLQIARSGGSPCQAKNMAFVELERQLAVHNLPRTGWRLLEQQDVTYLINAVIR